MRENNSKESKMTAKITAAYILYAVTLTSIYFTARCNPYELDEETDENIMREYKERNLKEIEETLEQSYETKIFEPEEHILYMPESKVNLQSDDMGDIEKSKVSYRIICPEGYELLGVTNEHSENYYLFVNTQTVEVKDDGSGSYTNFGTPIEKEKNEKTQKVKTK